MSADLPITVLMPTRNTVRYVGRAIESILEQKFDGFELLILDDGSTDETCDVVSTYRDPRIRLLRRNHRGLGATLREGVELSQGRYIARMDADDEAYPDRLTLQKNVMDQRPGCGMCHGRVDVIDTEGRIISRRSGFISDSIGTKWQLIWKNAVIHPTVMIRKDTLLTNGLNYRQDLKSSEDFDLWNCLSLVSDIEGLKGPLLRYRSHGQSFTATNERDFHFEYFVSVLKNNFSCYGVELGITEAEELAVISEHTKVDPRRYRYEVLTTLLKKLFDDMNERFREYHQVKNSELASVQSRQLMTWARYLSHTSRSAAIQLLVACCRNNLSALATTYFWLVLAYTLAHVRSEKLAF